MVCIQDNHQRVWRLSSKRSNSATRSSRVKLDMIFSSHKIRFWGRGHPSLDACRHAPRTALSPFDSNHVLEFDYLSNPRHRPQRVDPFARHKDKQVAWNLEHVMVILVPWELDSLT